MKQQLRDVSFLEKVFFKSSQDMAEVPAASVDLIVTSPPYFKIKDYSKDGRQQSRHSKRVKGQLWDIASYDAFLAELQKVWRECERVLKPNGKLVINVPLIPMKKSDWDTHYNRHIFDLNADIQHGILRRRGTKMFLLDTYIWSRPNGSKSLMFGSYPYPRNFYAQNTCEFVTVYVKDGVPVNGLSPEIKNASKLTQKEWTTFTSQVWSIPIPNKKDTAFGEHAALMPEEIVRRCVRLYSFVGDVVLDPFTGSWTTLKVAKELGRRFVGYEIVKSYAAVIAQKIGIAPKAPNRKNHATR